MRPNADDVLWELEDGLGLAGQEHERGSLSWRAVCPVCWHEADGDELRLRIQEVYGRGPALIECVAGCDEREIWNALGFRTLRRRRSVLRRAARNSNRSTWSRCARPCRRRWTGSVSSCSRAAT